MHRTTLSLFILASALVFAMGVPSAASAAEWLVNGVVPAVAFAAEASADEFLIGDAKIPVSMQCEFPLAGTIGPAGTGSITEVFEVVGGKKEKLIKKCVNVANCKAAEFEALGLPWKTSLVAVGAEFRDEVLNAGFRILCEGGLINDPCEGTNSMMMTNNIGGFVEGNYEAKQKFLTCTIGGAGQGFLGKIIKIFLPGGEVLSVS